MQLKKYTYIIHPIIETKQREVGWFDKINYIMHAAPIFDSWHAFMHPT